MISQSLYRILVPDAPHSRRTESDMPGNLEFLARAEISPFLTGRPVQPGLQAPTLVSSHAGAIERILFAFPGDSFGHADDVAAYRSVIEALRAGTEFVILHHERDRAEIVQWFRAAGHDDANVTYVPLPSYVTFTDWAEDAYVSLHDSVDGSHYLMEPWRFLRDGDALIADAVEEYTPSRASQAPLIFQGGNCLIGDGVWLLGKDYFADSVGLVTGSRPPVPVPAGADPATLVRQLFTDYLDSGRRLLVVGTPRPIPLASSVGSKEGRRYFIDLPAGGVGSYQPIFHIDMFITLVGADEAGRPRALVGSPRLADQMLGTSSPFALDDVYDSIADDLAAEGFQVTRNPLVHHRTDGDKFTLAVLRAYAAEAGNESFAPGVADLDRAGARDADFVQIRDWHHVTWNNCLVENSARHGKHVYMPTFGQGHAELAPLDSWMEQLWTSLGFQVHRLADFNRFARRQGVVHCIKKYLGRGA
jgi:hypothetical protein